MTVTYPHPYDFLVARADQCRALAAQGTDLELARSLELLAADYQAKANAMGERQPVAD